MAFPISKSRPGLPQQSTLLCVVLFHLRACLVSIEIRKEHAFQFLQIHLLCHCGSETVVKFFALPAFNIFVCCVSSVLEDGEILELTVCGKRMFFHGTVAESMARQWKGCKISKHNNFFFIAFSL